MKKKIIKIRGKGEIIQLKKAHHHAGIQFCKVWAS